ncbi:MAG TPA: cytochrome P450 [Capillimicrobium sp.]|nr:cytochrome P450 [Capillimicrobium sp.]
MPSLPPGPRMPRALQTLAWMTRPMPWMERLRDRHGDVFTVRIANEGTWVFLAHPDAVREVFTGDPAVLHAGEANRILRPWLGDNSVLLLDGPQHLSQRRLLLPPFHGERMQRYGDLMTAVAEREVATWPLGEPLQLWPRMQAVTLEVIVRAIFGVSDGERMERLRDRLRDATESTSDWRVMGGMAALGPDRYGARRSFRRRIEPVDELVFAEIRARREATDLAGRDDILSLLLQARHEDGSPMSDQELRDELMTLLLAGHETTATSLAWAIERLLRHPGGMERLRDGDEEYLDAVVKETLRLRPVLPIVVRRLQAPMEIAGWELPAGVTVAPCIHLVHRREDVYPEPHRFRPERFLEQPAGTYTWLPFGGGVRRCLGASFALFEMKAVLRVIARSVTLRAAAPQSEPVRRRGITLTPGRRAEVIASAA